MARTDCPGVLVHAAAIVTDCQHDKITGDKSWMFFTIFFIKGFYSGFYGEFAHPGNGIPGIDAQIGKDLVDLGRVHFHRPQMGGRLPYQIDVFTNEPAQHIQHTFHGIIQIQLLGEMVCFLAKASSCFVISAERFAAFEFL
jgi:hypothetical protein